MDVIQTVEALFDTAFAEIIGDNEAVEKLVDAIANKKKFKIQINGIGGDWENINIQTQVLKNRWIHNNIHNRRNPREVGNHKETS